VRQARQPGQLATAPAWSNPPRSRKSAEKINCQRDPLPIRSAIGMQEMSEPSIQVGRQLQAQPPTPRRRDAEARANRGRPGSRSGTYQPMRSIACIHSRRAASGQNRRVGARNRIQIGRLVAVIDDSRDQTNLSPLNDLPSRVGCNAQLPRGSRGLGVVADEY